MPGAGLSGLGLVVAGAEGAAGAGEDDDADRAVGSALSKARCSSASSSCVSAFIRSGRLSVMVAMLSSTL